MEDRRQGDGQRKTDSVGSRLSEAEKNLAVMAAEMRANNVTADALRELMEVLTKQVHMTSGKVERNTQNQLELSTKITYSIWGVVVILLGFGVSTILLFFKEVLEK